MWWITLPSASQTLCREAPTEGGRGGERETERNGKQRRQENSRKTQPGGSTQTNGIPERNNRKKPYRGKSSRKPPRNEGHETENARGVFCRTEGLLTKVEPWTLGTLETEDGPTIQDKEAILLKFWKNMVSTNIYIQPVGGWRRTCSGMSLEIYLFSTLSQEATRDELHHNHNQGVKQERKIWGTGSRGNTSRDSRGWQRCKIRVLVAQPD